jgi:hypothetical protein
MSTRYEARTDDLEVEQRRHWQPSLEEHVGLNQDARSLPS